ncbi:general transcription factor IIE subunit 1 isoform X1 [Olea europaea subsp. europaea]|uniref:General transcription factor IIE subunit 1 isoform X1 n=1 Tax=Olea europaea subsp. europaea TaxID=158383 RepID=A0A8S0S360_OLEEU|nr:general transcription factor IIE subunit 1 isoform X1 [Olea europaea subsp. europaea]
MGSHEALSVEPFKRLVKLAARAFYDDKTTKGDKQPKTGRSDNRGIAVVVLDALTRRQWVREEDLAKDLKLHSKQLRRTLRFFEEEKLVTRDHRKEVCFEGSVIWHKSLFPFIHIPLDVSFGFCLSLTIFYYLLILFINFLMIS